MKVWITKYALTCGIGEYDAELCDTSGGSMVRYAPQTYAHGDGREWHRTKEGAIERAEAMRVAKIASLRRAIANLEKLSFAEPT